MTYEPKFIKEISIGLSQAFQKMKDLGGREEVYFLTSILQEVLLINTS